MIKYKCASCGAKLETDDSLSGKQEACPACRKINLIPLSKHDLAEQNRQREEKPRQASAVKEENKQRRAAQVRADKQRRAVQVHADKQEIRRQAARQPPRPTGSMWAMGVLLVVVGVLWSIAAYAMDVAPSGDVVNLGRLNERLCMVIGGELCFLAGIILIGFARIEKALYHINEWRRERELEERKTT